jgi:polyhydroxyalkanoate synthesis regulator phasin
MSKMTEPLPYLLYDPDDELYREMFSLDEAKAKAEALIEQLRDHDGWLDSVQEIRIYRLVAESEQVNIKRNDDYDEWDEDEGVYRNKDGDPWLFGPFDYVCDYEMSIDPLERRLLKLEAENKLLKARQGPAGWRMLERLKEAEETLAFYADKKNWTTSGTEYYLDYAIVARDLGADARAHFEKWGGRC